LIHKLKFAAKLQHSAKSLAKKLI